MIAFNLMSIIPLLIVVYFAVNYIFPSLDTIVDVSIVILLTIFIAFLGLLLAKKLVEPVIDMALEAKIIAKGGLDREIKVDQEDEIGELGNAINAMTSRIKTNLEELSSYGERTKQLNLDINRKVIALANLLQVGDAISASTLPLENILNLISEKIAQTHDTGYTMLLGWEDEAQESMTVRASYDLPNDTLKDMKIRKGEAFLGELMINPTIYTIDKDTDMSDEITAFAESYSLKNLIILPVLSHNKAIGFLIVGNQLEDFKYKEDDVELYKVFVKQIAIAIENDYLTKRTKELTITDDLTGLYNKRYITTRLEEEIKRAILFQRPCAFIVIDVDDFNKLKKTYDDISVEKALKRIAEVLQQHVTEIGKAARFGPDEFALLLPEVNKKGAAKLSEEIRKDIEKAFSKKLAPEDIAKLTVSLGVSENPIDGSTAEELLSKAEKAIKVAKSLGKNKVVAHIGG